jgi:hypothetical protein
MTVVSLHSRSSSSSLEGLLGFLDFFRGRPPIRDAQALADFIDEHAAFLVQKGMYEYSRARAGHYAKVLFREPEFLQAVEEARWRAYPLGLAMVTELVEGILRPHGADRLGQLAALHTVVLGVFDRYPVPAELGAQAWSDARAELLRRLQLIGLHPPKFAKDVPANFINDYFSLLPIHESVRASEFPTIHNYLKITSCNIHDEFSRRAHVLVVVDALRSVLTHDVH